MKRLNFYPIYEEYLRSKKKTTTLRMGDYSALSAGDEVLVTIGWSEDNSVVLHSGTIKQVYRRRISDLTALDFDGESPDCKTQETARLVLGSIYRNALTLDDEVWVVKFEHI
jgi:hypothetical protein